MKRSDLPLETQRWYRFCDMPAAWQKASKRFQAKLRRANLRNLLSKYDLGRMVTRLVKMEGTNGPTAADEMARYTGVPGGVRALRYMKSFSEQYSKDFIIEQASKPMANGSFLTYEHFVELMAIRSLKTRKEFLARVRDEGLSVAKIAREIRRMQAEDKARRSREGGKARRE